MIPLRVPALLTAVIVISGCGLVDPNITDFRFVTDDKEFTIDTADWGLSGDVTLPSVPCQQTNDLCMQASSTFCNPGEAAECTAMCTAAATCSMTIQVALSNEIKLADESEFQTVNDQPLADVSVENVEYRVTENTLNTDSPVLDIYIGPLGTMSPDGAGAEHIGSVPSIPAGVQVEFTPIELTEQGRNHLRNFIEGEEYKSPFNVIVASRLVFGAGDRLPAGRAQVGVHIIANARPSL